MSRLTLKGKIFLWFGIIILISIVMYGFLIYSVYQFNLRGERYYYAMVEMKLKIAEQSDPIDESLIKELKDALVPISEAIKKKKHNKYPKRY